MPRLNPLLAVISLLTFYFLSYTVRAQNFGAADQATSILDKSRASIVFAHQNPTNPVSMFGHTFIVFHNDFPPEPLAPAIEFMGIIDSGLLDILGAVTTGIEGKFLVRTFVEKKTVYGLESRDLWVYEIALSDSELKLAKETFQALVDKDASYHFFSQNCSYWIYKHLNLYQECGGLGTVFTLPAETVRALDNCQRIKARHFLASDYTNAKKAYKKLKRSEQNAVLDVLDSGYLSQTPNFNANQKKAIGYGLNYLLPLERDSQRRKNLEQLKRGFPAEHAEGTPLPKDPSKFSRERKLTVTGFPNSDAVSLGYRHLQHDFTSAYSEHLQDSTLEILPVALYYSPSKTGLQYLYPVRIQAVEPNYFLTSPKVFHLEIGYEEWIPVHLKLREYKFSLGTGYAFRIAKLSVAALGYVGFRYKSLNRSDWAWKSNLGLIGRLSLPIHSQFRLRLDINPILESGMGYRIKSQLRVVTLELGRFNLETTAQVLDKDFRRGLYGLSLNLFF